VSEYVAKLRNYRISPRKARLVADLVRGKYVSDAIDQLKILNKKSAPAVLKLIESAVANAEAVATVDVDRLKIAEIMVGEGPTWKRYLPRAQGRATPIRKRTSHITVGLKEV
jgi:large subunit ribosomal protein L22